jgi:hypothetical protein
LQGRIDLTRALELSHLTGASRAGVPTLEGSVTEVDLLAALRLMINGTATDPLPLALNGLGYNNLLFIALALAHLESTTDARLGENAKLYPILAIEEPEAHLHAALQYRLLKYIIERTQPSKNNPRPTRQAFVTTHSSHITAAAGLDNIVCLTAPSGTEVPKVAYLARRQRSHDRNGAHFAVSTSGPEPLFPTSGRTWRGQDNVAGNLHQTASKAARSARFRRADRLHLVHRDGGSRVDSSAWP